MSETKTEYKMAYCEKQDVVAQSINPADLITKLKSIDSGYYVLWLYHGVFAGEAANIDIDKFNLGDNGQLQDYLLRMRVFNDEEEWHIWKAENGFKGRYRKDENVSEKEESAIDNRTPFVDTKMLLRGIVGKQLRILEKFSWNDNIYLNTRNYIGFNETGQACYVDSRFVEFL